MQVLHTFENIPLPEPSNQTIPVLSSDGGVLQKFIRYECTS